MKKIILVFFMGAAMVAAMGQTPYANVGNPPFSLSYYFNSANDSLFDVRTNYEYDANNLIIKEWYVMGQDTAFITREYNANDQIVKEWHVLGQDTTLITRDYDVSDRIVLYQEFENSVLYSEKTWNYDEVAERIDYYQSTASQLGSPLDSIMHVIYYGVNDFSAVENATLFDMFFEGMDLEMRDCDSIVVSYVYESVWLTYMKMVPTYQNGKPATVIMEMDLAALGVDPSQLGGIESVTIPWTFTYTGEQLTRIEGDITNIPLIGTLSDVFVLTNQYNSAGLLLETQIIMNIALMDVYEGAKYSYAYNTSDDRIVSFSSYTASAANAWVIEERENYYYDEDLIVRTLSASNITQTEATLRGAVFATDADVISSVGFRYKLNSESDYTWTTASVPTGLEPIMTPFTGQAENLLPGSMYDYSPFVVTTGNDTLYGAPTSFITNPDVSIIESVSEDGISIYPNPASDHITVVVADGSQTNLSLYDVQGRIIRNIPNFDSQEKIDISMLSEGIYFLKIETKNNVVVKKIVKAE